MLRSEFFDSAVSAARLSDPALVVVVSGSTSTLTALVSSLNTDLVMVSDPQHFRECVTDALARSAATVVSSTDASVFTAARAAGVPTIRVTDGSVSPAGFLDYDAVFAPSPSLASRVYGFVSRSLGSAGV